MNKLTYCEIVKRCGEIGVERDVAIGELATVKQQRDDLLAACEALMAMTRIDTARKLAQAAIGKA